MKNTPSLLAFRALSLISALARAGKRLPEIAEALNKLGYPAPGRRGTWLPHQVQKLRKKIR